MYTRYNTATTTNYYKQAIKYMDNQAYLAATRGGHGAKEEREVNRGENSTNQEGAGGKGAQRKRRLPGIVFAKAQASNYDENGYA